MPAQLSEQLFSMHPAFTSQASLEGISGKYEFSYEFAYFLNSWGNGKVGSSPFHQRNFQIAQRKGCFSPILINDLGYLTDHGREVFLDAQRIMSQIRTYHANVGEELPNPEFLPHDPESVFDPQYYQNDVEGTLVQANIPLDAPDSPWTFFDHIDKMLVYGALSMRSLQYLTLLFNNMQTEPKRNPAHQTPLKFSQTTRTMPEITKLASLSIAGLYQGNNPNGGFAQQAQVTTVVVGRSAKRGQFYLTGDTDPNSADHNPYAEQSSPTAQPTKFYENSDITATSINENFNWQGMGLSEPPQKYLLIGSLHHRPSFRSEFDRLIRYGFVSLHALPKFDHQHGRGRAPVGARITAAGAMFFLRYLRDFDPSIIRFGINT